MKSALLSPQSGSEALTIIVNNELKSISNDHFNQSKISINIPNWCFCDNNLSFFKNFSLDISISVITFYFCLINL